MFKIVTKEHLTALDVAASARQFKDQVQDGISTLLTASLQDGETLPDLAFFQELLGRLLERSGNGLAGVDESYTQRLVTAAAQRVRRDELKEKLRLRMTDTRALLDRAVPSKTLNAFLRQRRFSSVKPLELVQSARDMVNTLRDPQHGLDNLAGSSFSSASALASMLEAEANELEQVLQQLSPQKKASQEGLEDKTDKVTTAKARNRRCADALFGLYRLAGLDFHAARVRARVRRRTASGGASGEATNGASGETSGGSAVAPQEVPLPVN